jgi:YgiT-type zinc finger domain-containing protein
MNCYECGSEMEIIKDKPYEYKDCGLPNVVLFGIPQYKCNKCNEFYVSIPKIKQLHKIIGIYLCCEKEKLYGVEIRYLRKEMRLKAIDFSRVLSISPETLSRIENDNQDASEQLEKLIRSTYMNLILIEQDKPSRFDIVKMLEGAAKLPKTPTKKIKINPSEWINDVLSPISCPSYC